MALADLPVNACDLISSGLARDARVVVGWRRCRRGTVRVDEIRVRINDLGFPLFGHIFGRHPPWISDSHAVRDIAIVVDAECDPVADTRVGWVAFVMIAEAVLWHGEINSVVIFVLRLECFHPVPVFGDPIRVLGLV